MTWACPTCRNNYARRKDHDESATNKKCLIKAAYDARDAWEHLLGDGGIGRGTDKEINKAFAKMKIAERKLK